MKCMERVQYQCAPEVTPRLIGELLTEADILFLSDTFFSNGFHHIRVKNIDAGRQLISILMRSMKIYNEIACVTVADTQSLELYKESPFFNVYQEMHNNNMTHNNDCEAFLLEHFYANYMWIESTSVLQSQPWFDNLIKTIIDLKVDQQIPILILSYQN